MTTPADELKTAAQKLRELATTASTNGRGKPTSTWHFAKQDNRDSGYLYAANPNGPGLRITPAGGSHPGMRTRHGEYAAAMDTTEGILLADWLASWDGTDINEHATMPDDLRHALLIARTINGGQP